MYVVIKTIKGRRYRYLQTCWREGKRVRTRSVCLGLLNGNQPVSARRPRTSTVAAFFAAQRLSAEDRILATAERKAAEWDRYQRATFGETAAERAEREHIEHLAQLYSAYGLTVSDPKVAEAAKAVAAQSSAADAEKCPSSDEGQESSTDAAAIGEDAVDDGADSADGAQNS